MSENGNPKPGNPSFKRFVICLFGGSGAGKTTVLGRLIDMLRRRAQYNLEVSEGFQTHDLRSIMWYRTGRKYSGGVCVCTMGDTVEIIQKNFDFFETHFNNQRTFPELLFFHVNHVLRQAKFKEYSKKKKCLVDFDALSSNVSCD